MLEAPTRANENMRKNRKINTKTVLLLISLLSTIKDGSS